MDVDQVVALMRESKPRMTLDVEFDVFVAAADIPAGTSFCVKLIKPSGSTADYGMTFSQQQQAGCKTTVLSVSPGSIAHRMGSIRPGDVITAVHNLSLESCDDVLAAINAQPIVRMKLLRKPSGQPADDGEVVYTVELIRRGGPLGVTISGTESPDDPVTISALTEGTERLVKRPQNFDLMKCFRRIG